jgi:hypothetical protein
LLKHRNDKKQTKINQLRQQRLAGVRQNIENERGRRDNIDTNTSVSNPQSNKINRKEEKLASRQKIAKSKRKVSIPKRYYTDALEQTVEGRALLGNLNRRATPTQTNPQPETTQSKTMQFDTQEPETMQFDTQEPEMMRYDVSDVSDVNEATESFDDTPIPKRNKEAEGQVNLSKKYRVNEYVKTPESSAWESALRDSLARYRAQEKQNRIEKSRELDRQSIKKVLKKQE